MLIILPFVWYKIGSSGCEFADRSLTEVIIIIIINRFVLRHKVVTSEALGPGSVLVSIT